MPCNAGAGKGSKALPLVSRAALLGLHDDLQRLVAGCTHAGLQFDALQEQEGSSVVGSVQSDVAGAGACRQGRLRTYGAQKRERGGVYMAAWDRLRRTALFAAWITKPAQPALEPAG